MAALKQQLKPLINRLRSWPLRLLALLLPYPAGARLLYALAASDWAHRRGFARQRRLLADTAALVPDCAVTSELLTHSLAANLGRFYRMAAIARLSPLHSSQWLRIDGLERLRAALATGQGVIILNSHTSLAHLLTLALQRNNYAQVHTIGDDAVKRHIMGLAVSKKDRNALNDKDAQFLQQLQAAKLALREGGMVQIAADGSYGKSGVDAEFFTRQRFFRSGFAELAAMSQAVLLPAQVTLQAHGVVTVAFGEPLMRDPALRGHRAMVAAFMAQYIAFNRSLWQAHCADLKWAQLRRFLQLPAAQDSASPQPGGRYQTQRQ